MFTDSRASLPSLRRPSPTTISDQAVIIGRSYRRLGKDPDRLFAHFGFRVANTPNASLRLPALTMADVWNLAESDCGPDFRLRAAESFDESLYHLLTPLLLSSRCVREMLQKLVLYSGVISSAAVFRLHEANGQIGIEIVEDRPQKSAAACDIMRFYICRMAKLVCDDAGLLTSVDFSASESDVNLPLWDHIAFLLRYDCAKSIIWFDKEIAESGNGVRQSRLLPIESFVISYLSAFEDEQAVTMRLQSLLECACFFENDFSVQQIAKRLRVSTRTLQRQLLLSETSLRDELHHARCLRSHRLLTGTRRPVTDIALDLGFTDTAHFSNSYKRWSGVSPRAYRNRVARQIR